MKISAALRQPPDVWMGTQKTPVTLEQVMRRYDMTRETAINMLNTLVRERRVTRLVVDEEIKWTINPRM